MFGIFTRYNLTYDIYFHNVKIGDGEANVVCWFWRKLTTLKAEKAIINTVINDFSDLEEADKPNLKINIKNIA